jgi:AcrR family transcriptional regulator
MMVTESQLGLRLPRTRQARRERIVTAGFELLLDADYDSVQMRDVAERAGVALATVYRYFPSKEQLFGHVLMRWHEDRWQRLGGRSQGNSNRERLTDVALRTVAAYEKEPQFLTLKFRLEQSGDPAVSDYLEYIGRGAFRMFRAKLDGLSDDEAATIVVIVISVIMAEINRWVRGTRRIDQVRSQVARTIELLLEFADPAYLQQLRAP